MPALWLPPGVGEEMLQAQKAHAADTIAGDFQRRLKTIDQRLGVCFVDQPDDQGALRVGYWHIYRRNPDGSLTWWEISGPDGEFIEPTERVLERFRELDAATNRDMQKPDFFRRLQERRLRAQERRQARAREQAATHLKELADFEFRTQVPASPDRRGRLRDRRRR